ncbi:diaminopropionate ammonia-lyase [Labrys okinawensis]|uniref:Diaminopropionate ammonia-lyase n=1 Tax=Labrys okinawensis TaxID=346911 RepID=A0A2S9QCI4_9HYPH|nr:diaminopropionate ammonia-lyase [Labrys okinawensis]PRH87054.1 diaminopropionate ammonia-lyase [Labrys okinawensis]
MLLANSGPHYRSPLPAQDAAMLGSAGADEVGRFLALRADHHPTPLLSLPALAARIGIRNLFVKDEGQRLDLCSFKALGGAYAVVRLVIEEASRQLGRQVDYSEIGSADVRSAAAGMIFACATDGNHGRSVAQGARFVGAKAVIFVHGGVSQGRVEAIAAFGADIVRVNGTYDDSVTEAARVSQTRGWTIVSDTSWEGYERIPSLVMQGYTTILREALLQMREPPTHLFVQAGVGGVAAALGGHAELVLEARRPKLVVVEPALSACVFASAKAGRPVKVSHGAPTVMAMLECYEPSQVAWRILARVADGFMTIDDGQAIAAMNDMARPLSGDPAIVAGESGAAGLAGLLRATRDDAMRQALGLDADARVLVINSEGATDPERYRDLVGLTPEDVQMANAEARA